jgi:tetratricopeptide (TPR) repeat protein
MHSQPELGNEVAGLGKVTSILLSSTASAYFERMTTNRCRWLMTIELLISSIDHTISRGRGGRVIRCLLVGAAVISFLGGSVVIGEEQKGPASKANRENASRNSGRSDDNAVLREAVELAVAPKPMVGGQLQPGPFPADIVEKAKLLIQFGDREKRALGLVALKRHVEADRIIQQLKQEPPRPAGQRLRLYLLEGDNLYLAGDPDRAIMAYEKATGIAPDDVTARTSLMIALVYSRHDASARCQRAIGIADDTVKLVPPNSPAWATIQVCRGIAWYALPTGDIRENAQKAIAACEAALAGFRRRENPADWAMTQTNLGLAWLRLPEDPRGETLKKALAAFAAAIGVYSKAKFPLEWARTQRLIGNTWLDMPVGDKSDNQKKGIEALEAALTELTLEANAHDWAQMQEVLGYTWSQFPGGDKEKNLKRAIDHDQAALKVFTPTSYSAEWAETQNDLALAWTALRTGDKDANLERAIAAREAVLSVQTRQADPVRWAKTLVTVGSLWADLHRGVRDSANRAENLKKALDLYTQALTVLTKEANPTDWAMTQNRIAYIWVWLPAGDPEENRQKAIAANEAALSVYTKESQPSDWAYTLNCLGANWQNLKTGDRADYIRRAIAAYEMALTVRTKEAAPRDWAETQWRLGNAWFTNPAGDHTENVKKAITAYQNALSVYTAKEDPLERTRAEMNLRMALDESPQPDPPQVTNLKAFLGSGVILMPFVPLVLSRRWVGPSSRRVFVKTWLLTIVVFALGSAGLCLVALCGEIVPSNNPPGPLFNFLLFPLFAGALAGAIGAAAGIPIGFIRVFLAKRKLRKTTLAAGATG